METTRPGAEVQPASVLDFVLTDAVLDELKRQAPAGCVLCALDEFDVEDWD